MDKALRIALLRAAALALIAFATAGTAPAGTFVVDSVGDAPDADLTDGICRTSLGTCTLRAAIEQANASAGADTIAFSIPGPGVHTISPTAYLPILTDDGGVTIDGYSQPGSSPNTLAVGDNAVLTIEIDGSTTPSGFAGMITVLSSNNKIRGLVINRYLVEDCLAFYGNNNVIEGNFLGTDATGLIARPCRGAIQLGGFGNLVGGPTPGSRNVLAAQSLNTVDLTGYGSHVFQGNYVGTDRNGTFSLGSPFHGIAVESDGNFIGGGTPGAGNLISGNGTLLGHGVLVISSNNTIAGNLIGTTADGSGSIPNGQYGIQVSGMSNGNTIRGNLIAFNRLAGVKIGHFSDTPTTQNTISANSIFANGGLAIDLGNEGVTLNDPCDSDVGPNKLQNFPFLSSAVRGNGLTTIRGILNSAPDALYRIEVFQSSVCDPTGYGPGESFLGSFQVTTDASCNARFEASLPVVVPVGALITATATDVAGNTSEFSACRSVMTGMSFYSITPCRVGDTRTLGGGPPLTPAFDRSFSIAGQCGIPPDAAAVAFNFAVTRPTAPGDVQVFAGGTPLPVPPLIYYSGGQTRAKNAVLGIGVLGDIGTHVDQPSGTVDFIIDVTGYFR